MGYSGDGSYTKFMQIANFFFFFFHNKIVTMKRGKFESISLQTPKIPTKWQHPNRASELHEYYIFLVDHGPHPIMC